MTNPDRSLDGVDKSRIPQIGLLIFPEVEELDFVGPWEVFTAAEAIACGEDRPASNVHLIADSPAKLVTCAKGLRVAPTAVLSNSECDNLDIFLASGGRGTRRLARDKAFIERIRKISHSSGCVASVCSGALLLASAGLLCGKRVTTHWGVVDLLKDMEPTAMVAAEERYVIDDEIATAAGVSAGIDLALALVGALYGEAHAVRTQKYLQYAPMPPFVYDPTPEVMFPKTCVLQAIP